MFFVMIAVNKAHKDETGVNMPSRMQCATYGARHEKREFRSSRLTTIGSGASNDLLGWESAGWRDEMLVLLVCAARRLPRHGRSRSRPKRLRPRLASDEVKLCPKKRRRRFQKYTPGGGFFLNWDAEIPSHNRPARTKPQDDHSRQSGRFSLAPVCGRLSIRFAARPRSRVSALWDRLPSRVQGESLHGIVDFFLQRKDFERWR
ncbi:hypothetical protein ACVIGB_008381 [Bradyrhizobium sp. USDA 4341]